MQIIVLISVSIIAPCWVRLVRTALKCVKLHAILATPIGTEDYA